ncbi:polysaccharide deacetylase family protein [Curvibacter sp. HBC28]|uniref:Polysaccharide deacetylase family protein n=1 Tax=Curvibacter microcysteis TaxID=3026419 RepID=A0ABT5M9Q5_9BURK|nr:polysaccharide deacetylase family protein [Curvibacter sp. HBC28]MDD0813323.1 polysaccharide deacetylase family protein [Curvibacter sp. HBC28]
MSVIALKIDVDTFRGTREGVPALARLLEKHDAPATFLFSLGPDHTGRALKRVFRPGFFGKVARTSVVEHYGIKTLMYGVMLPGPDIGRCEAEGLRAIRRAGFETGVHTWDHVRWQDGVAQADEAWTRRELQLATERYAEVFGERPTVHGAAGWQMNEAAYRLQAELGYTVASDGRGEHPYWPCNAQGQVIGPVQLPSTLPTLDELIGLDGWTVDNVHEALLARTRTLAPLHVYTLHAELEGQKLAPVFERLLRGWREQGYRFATVGDCARQLDLSALPRCPVALGTIPGRSGTLVVQQPAFA